MNPLRLILWTLQLPQMLTSDPRKMTRTKGGQTIQSLYISEPSPVQNATNDQQDRVNHYKEGSTQTKPERHSKTFSIHTNEMEKTVCSMKLESKKKQNS